MGYVKFEIKNQDILVQSVNHLKKLLLLGKKTDYIHYKLPDHADSNVPKEFVAELTD